MKLELCNVKISIETKLTMLKEFAFLIYCFCEPSQCPNKSTDFPTGASDAFTTVSTDLTTDSGKAFEISKIDGYLQFLISIFGNCNCSEVGSYEI